MPCIKVEVITLCGKPAKQLIFKEMKEVRRRHKLKRLIQEVRELRRKLNAPQR